MGKQAERPRRTFGSARPTRFGRHQAEFPAWRDAPRRRCGRPPKIARSRESASGATRTRADTAQRALDGIVAVLGAWTIIEAFAFEATNLEWWSFASACALAALSTVGLVLHEMSTERVVHELSVTKAEPRPRAAA